jgi:hypothetical protein
MPSDETTQSSVESHGTSTENPKLLDNRSKSSAEAVVEIFNSLQPYDEDTRQKILASVMTLLGIAPVSTPTISGILPGSGPGSTSSGSNVTPITRRPLSPAELIQAKEPVTNAQRIIVFAYYREKYESMNYFARDDLKPYFSKARLSIPANYDRDFNDAVKQGWLYENGNESYLTSKGFQAVEVGFGGKAAPRGKAAKSKSTRTSKKSPSLDNSSIDKSSIDN